MTTATVWTEAMIVDLLTRSEAAVERALRRIQENQTVAERANGTTHELNGIGFNKNDAPFAKSLLEWRDKGRNWSARQLACARKMAIRYRKQLVAAANGQPVVCERDNNIACVTHPEGQPDEYYTQADLDAEYRQQVEDANDPDAQERAAAEDAQPFPVR